MQGGMYFRLGHDGRFAYVPDAASSPSDGSLMVTDIDPSASLSAIINAIHGGGSVPLPIAGRWTVAYPALMLAIHNGTRVAFTPYAG